MLNVPAGQFTEATAVWVGCILAFGLVVLLRRVWIRRAKGRKASTRRVAVGESPVEEP